MWDYDDVPLIIEKLISFTKFLIINELDIENSIYLITTNELQFIDFL